jgi:hypothetical protein
MSAGFVRLARPAANNASPHGRKLDLHCELPHAARQEAKPLSHARMIPGGFRKEIVPAGFAAEAQSQVVMADKT